MSFPELSQLENLISTVSEFAKVEVLAEVSDEKNKYPIHKISFGTNKPNAPVLGFVGGVHGLERIGSQVCLSLMNSFSQLLLWDKSMQRNLENMQIFFIPIVNPIGIKNRWRCNTRGVDLMRNAPVDAEPPVPFLLGGHRYSPYLPWYRGPLNSPMETESLALIKGVTDSVQQSSQSIVVDIHSGFGVVDRLWFPYSKTQKPFPHLSEVHALKDLLDRTYPHHFYQIEPQSKGYTLHGDLWDYMYDEQLKKNSDQLFLPLCLEMGSWLWVKKNPLQLFSSSGPFNPVKKHREKRILRRHNTLFEFLIRAILSGEAWADLSPERKSLHQQKAMELWYE